MEKGIPKTKRCSDCHIVKSIGDFYMCPSRSFGVRSTCKKCDALRSRKYRDEHRNDLSVQYQAYFKTHKSEINTQRRKRYKKHKSKINARRRSHYGEHKIKIQAQNRKYAVTEKGKLTDMRHRHKRRALLKCTKATLTADQWAKILSIQNNRCNVCGKRFTVKRLSTTDHIIPLSHSGELTFENVQALCRSCNSRKQASLDPQFIQTWL